MSCFYKLLFNLFFRLPTHSVGCFLGSRLEEAIEPVWSRCARTTDEPQRAALGLAHRALLSGRPELVGGVRALLPPAGLDATDAAGLTALMKAAAVGDDQIVAVSTYFTCLAALLLCKQSGTEVLKVFKHNRKNLRVKSFFVSSLTC